MAAIRAAADRSSRIRTVTTSRRVMETEAELFIASRLPRGDGIRDAAKFRSTVPCPRGSVFFGDSRCELRSRWNDVPNRNRTSAPAIPAVKPRRGVDESGIQEFGIPWARDRETDLAGEPSAARYSIPDPKPPAPA